MLFYVLSVIFSLFFVHMDLFDEIKKPEGLSKREKAQNREKAQKYLRLFECMTHPDNDGYMCFLCAFYRSQVQQVLEKAGKPVTARGQFLRSQVEKAYNTNTKRLIHKSTETKTKIVGKQKKKETRKGTSAISSLLARALADCPEAYPRDDCPLCDLKLFPMQHGTSPEKLLATRFPRDYDVFQGSKCGHMFHEGCIRDFFKEEKSSKSKSGAVAKCPVCPLDIEEKRILKIWLK